MLSFTCGAVLPVMGALLGSALHLPALWMTACILASVTVGLVVFGAMGAWLGGANVLVGAGRVVIGGWLAMAAVYGIGSVFGSVVP